MYGAPNSGKKSWKLKTTLEKTNWRAQDWIERGTLRRGVWRRGFYKKCLVLACASSSVPQTVGTEVPTVLQNICMWQLPCPQSLNRGLCVRLQPINNFQQFFTTRGPNHVTYGSQTAVRYKHFLEYIKRTAEASKVQEVSQDVQSRESIEIY